MLDTYRSWRAWRSARTLEDLAELTARWLEGDLPRQPGYYGRVDVDEDEAPGLTAALVGANRAGLLTMSSQAAMQGEWGRQVAWVSGFLLPRRRIITGRWGARRVYHQNDVEVVVQTLSPMRLINGRMVDGQLVPVTWDDQDMPVTVDCHVSDDVIAGDLYPWVSDGLCRTVAMLEQVSITCPTNDLWPWLLKVSTRQSPVPF